MDNLTPPPPNSSIEQLSDWYPIIADYFLVAINAALLLPFLTVGNALTVLAVALTPQFRTLTYLHVANVAAADFMVGLGSAFAAARSIQCLLLFPATNDRFTTITISFTYFATTESLLGLLLLAVERLVYIAYPFLYLKPATGRAFRYAVALSWILSVTMGALTAYFERNFQADCVGDEDLGRDYYHAAIPGIFISASLVSFLCYAKIIHVSREQRRRIAQLTTGLEPCARLQVNCKSVGVFFVVNTIFIVCWLPYVTVVAIFGCENSSIQTRGLLFTLGTASSAFNVFIYAQKIKTFRKVCVRLLRCYC